MRLMTKESLLNNGFFKLKDSSWLEKQRVAGRIVAGTLSLLEKQVKDKTTLSLLELNKLGEEYILDNKCSATFKDYKGFPAGVCISVNEQLVHGIPTDYHLQEGDVISFDLGATFEGAIADSALTCIYGEPKKTEHVKIIKACEEAMLKGIAAIKVGNHLGCIGNAIYKSAKGNGFNVITQYGGHGLDWDQPHAPPFVENKSNIDSGFRIQAGLTLAIEPMLVPTDTTTHTSKDGWTVYTREIGTHFEHTIFIHEDHVEIITKRD